MQIFIENRYPDTLDEFLDQYDKTYVVVVTFEDGDRETYFMQFENVPSTEEVAIRIEEESDESEFDFEISRLSKILHLPSELAA